MDSVLEKFYKCELDNGILKAELDKIKNDLSEGNRELKSLNNKIYQLELLIESLKLKNNNTESFWGGIIDFTVKIIYVLVVSYALYLLGWEGPPV